MSKNKCTSNRRGIIYPATWGIQRCYQHNVCLRCEGAVMAANACTFLSLLLIYAISNVDFQTKTSKTHLFSTNNSPTAPRIAIHKRNLEYFAVVV